MRITQANPPEEIGVSINNGPDLLNCTIFRHLAEAGYSKKRLEGMIRSSKWVQLDIQLYKKDVYLDPTGLLMFLESDEEPQEIIEEDCYHGFVVHNVKGDNRFLCRECDERFPRHPSMMDKKPAAPPDSELLFPLSEFREGLLTFAQVAQKTTLSLNALKDAIKRLFPPNVETIQHRSINGQLLAPVVIDQEVQRTSCPKEIDDLYSDPDVTMYDLERIRKDPYVFPDIVNVRHTPSIQSDMTIVMVEFIDGTVQRIEIDNVDMMNKPRLGVTINGKQHFVKVYKTVDA